MAQSAITTKVHEPLNIHGNFTTSIALDLVFVVDDVTDTPNFHFCQVISAGIEINAGLGQNLLGGGTANAIDVSESHFTSFISR